MLTYDDFVSGLETIKGLLNSENASRLNELGERVCELAHLTKANISEVTEALRRICMNSGLSLEECLDVLNGAIQMEGENEEMAINVPYKEIGKWNNTRVIEVSLNNYITMLLAHELEDICYVITETLAVAKKDWIIGRITSNRRNITETKHVSARTAYAVEIRKRVPTPVAQEMVNGVSGSLITSRPAIAHYVKEGEQKLREQRDRGRKLVEELSRGSQG
jgi:hypothetical protein